MAKKSTRSSVRPRVGRPTLGLAPRQTISIKVDPLLLQGLRAFAKMKGLGYQSLIHQILEEYVRTARVR